MEVEKEIKRSSSRSVFGVLLIGVGGLFLLNYFGFIPAVIADVIFTWQMLLIGIGLANILIRGNMQSGLITLTVGAFFLFPKVTGIAIDWKLIGALLLVVIGSIMIFVRQRPRSRGMIKGDKQNFIDVLTIFSGSERKVQSQDFKGGKLTTAFGGADIDLLDADIKGEAVLDIFTMFGGAEISVPRGWDVQVDVVSIFGACEDKRNRIEPNPEKKVLRVKGFVIFGGAEVKS